ncbi:hypothetical protein, partial [Bartonella quintana]|uniref:hypothetical protein n=1 Tax=Bartonella quintana TaxID=803 RepID=UPI001F30AFD9
IVSVASRFLEAVDIKRRFAGTQLHSLRAHGMIIVLVVLIRCAVLLGAGGMPLPLTTCRGERGVIVLIMRSLMRNVLA